MAWWRALPSGRTSTTERLSVDAPVSIDLRSPCAMEGRDYVPLPSFSSREEEVVPTACPCIPARHASSRGFLGDARAPDGSHHLEKGPRSCSFCLGKAVEHLANPTPAPKMLLLDGTNASVGDDREEEEEGVHGEGGERRPTWKKMVNSSAKERLLRRSLLMVMEGCCCGFRS